MSVDVILRPTVFYELDEYVCLVSVYKYANFFLSLFELLLNGCNNNNIMNKTKKYIN